MHILAVDDDPMILELLVEFVNFIGGHTLETALCVTDALELFTRPDAVKFDCFLLDVQMPCTDGIELCKIIRDLPEYQKTPILMLTAMSDKSYIDRAFAAGASDYITKPFEIAELRGRIGLVDSMVANLNKQAAASVSEGAESETGTNNECAETELSLHEIVPIKDVDGVIELQALENYVSLLSKKQVFGSSVLAFSICGIEELFEKASRFELECLVTDVAEAISACLGDHQFMISYAGNGSFVCVIEQGWQPDSSKLTNEVNLTLHHMELFHNDGTPMTVKVCAGDLIRLVWKSGDKAIDALAAAHESAEKERQHHSRNLNDLWYIRQSA